MYYLGADLSPAQDFVLFRRPHVFADVRSLVVSRGGVSSLREQGLAMGEARWVGALVEGRPASARAVGPFRKG